MVNEQRTPLMVAATYVVEAQRRNTGDGVDMENHSFCGVVEINGGGVVSSASGLWHQRPKPNRWTSRPETKRNSSRHPTRNAAQAALSTLLSQKQKIQLSLQLRQVVVRWYFLHPSLFSSQKSRTSTETRAELVQVVRVIAVAAAAT
ncbi:hypothetical protein ACFX12_038581 [Malus domestica]